MPATRDKAAIVEAMGLAFDGLLDLGATLSEDEWNTPSELPGWSIKDNYSHCVGAEGGIFLGWPPPTVDVPDAPHLKNPIAKVNEAWIVHYRSSTGAEVLEAFAGAVAERKAALAAMTDEAFHEVGFTPAGQDEHGRFLQVRIFDCWLHEQDCRGPLDRPGHESGIAAEVMLDEFTTAAGFVVGKKAGAADGQSVRLNLTGPTSRVIDVRVDGRAGVVDDLEDPTTTITIPTMLWMRYASGRRPGDVTHPDVHIAGDEDLGARVIGNAAYTI